ncbi:MAG: type II secretion system protein [Thermodesulfobacteriota bacterium]
MGKWGPGGDQGFSFVALLFAITLIGIALATTGVVWSTNMQREREAELLFRGGQIRDAIGRYYNGSPGAKRYPRKLEDLIKDRRQPSIKRYLRKLYTDPMTGNSDWQAVKAKDGGIMGVKSNSKKEPYKKGNFREEFSSFEGKESYNSWEFVYKPEDESRKETEKGKTEKKGKN